MARQPRADDGLLESELSRPLRAEIKRAAADIIDDVRAEIEADIHRSKLHDDLIDICASAFGPGSEGSKLGYSFLCADPLFELSVKSFDVLIYNTKTKTAILVECKSALAAVGEAITSAYEAITEATARKAHLEKQVGDRIERFEFVVCTPSEITNRVVREIERREKAGEIPEAAPRLLVWSVNKFDGQTLTLDPRVSTRPKHWSQHADPKLTHLLANSVRVDSSEVVVKAYPSSHPFRIATQIATQVWLRTDENGIPAKTFEERTVLEFLKDTRNIPHYALGGIAEKMFQKFIRDGEDAELVLEDEESPRSYTIKIEGRTLKTLVSKFQKAWIEWAAERLALRRATERIVAEKRKMYPPLASFDEESRGVPPP